MSKKERFCLTWRAVSGRINLGSVVRPRLPPGRRSVSVGCLRWRSVWEVFASSGEKARVAHAAVTVIDRQAQFTQGRFRQKQTGLLRMVAFRHPLLLWAGTEYVSGGAWVLTDSNGGLRR
jgi:hypothetical protein